MASGSAPRPSDGLRLRAVVWLLGARLGLWVLPFRTVCRLLAWLVDRLPPPAAVAHTPALVARAVDGAARAVPRATCLPRAFAAWGMLRRQGTAAAVHLGVRSGGSKALLGAHAWVVADGVVVLGGDVAGLHDLGSLSVALGDEGVGRAG